MFKSIRKKINEIDHSAAEALLQSNRRGILAMNGDNGYPYAIPINYFYDCVGQKIGSIINVGVTPLRCHFQHYFFAKK